MSSPSRRALEPTEFPFLDYRRFTFSLGIEAAGSVWLAGNTGARFDAARGGMVVEGDLVAQAGVVFDKMRLTLAAGGLGLGDIVRVVQYVAPAALGDLPRLAALEAELFGGAAPVVSTIPVARLLRAEALVEIEAVARPSGLRYLPAVTGPDPATAWAAAGRALQAAGLGWDRVVRTVEIFAPAAAARPDAATARATHLGSAVAGLQVVVPRLVDPAALVQVELTATFGPAADVVFAAAEGDPAAGDVVAQCRDAYRRIDKLLAAAGTGLDAVVKTTEFVTPPALGEYRRTADVRRETFAPPYPAATGVVCERLLRPGALLTVEAVAVRARA